MSDAIQGFSDRDYEFFAQKVQKSFGLRLRDYKAEQMMRRIASLATQLGRTSFLTYFTLLESDPAALGAFMDHVTINVTELLRNPTLFETLTHHARQALAAPSGGAFSVWSAGCSYGAEAYSIALLLSELGSARPVRIRGTDIDLAMLAKANSPTFSKSDMVNVSPARRAEYFTSFDGETFMPTMKLRSMIQFSRHDLLGETYPTAHYDLIVCRNVLIYFTNEAKRRVYEGLNQALKPGGVLFVGGTETIAEHAGLGFELIEPFFYRKPAAQVWLPKAA